MNEITIFENPEFGKVRAAELDDQIYFCGPETASAVDNSTTRKTSNSPCRGVTKRDTSTSSGNQGHCKGVVDLSTPSNGGNQDRCEGVAKRDGVPEMMPPLQANEISVFNQSEVLGKTVSVYGTSEAPLFLARDVAEWIDYAKSSDGYYQVSHMLGSVDDEEKLLLKVLIAGQLREAWFLTENGLYEVFMLSKKPKAKIFKAEVKKILKTIRRHGAYLTPAKLEEALLNPDVLIRLATNLKAEQEKSAWLEAKIEADKPKVQYADAVLATNDCILVSELAKLLCQNGFQTGQRRLFDLLRMDGWLMRDGRGRYIPKQYPIEQGYMRIKPSVVYIGKSAEIVPTILITPKGQQFFISRYARYQFPLQGVTP